MRLNVYWDGHPRGGLSKAVGEITAADIEGLVNSRVREGERIEFKKELSTPAGASSWATDQKIAKEAKNQILKEVVAFANAFGGALVLGIDEDRRSIPPGAGRIILVSKCPLAELGSPTTSCQCSTGAER